MRCRAEHEGLIQTKLLRTEYDNSCREYRVGESEVIDGLVDYVPLVPGAGARLVVAVGDWDCSECGLAWQWARATFDVDESSGRAVGTLRELSSLQPHAPGLLSEVHFVEGELARLSGLWNLADAWDAGLARWHRLTVDERCNRVADGYRAWAQEVAGVVLPSPGEAAD